MSSPLEVVIKRTASNKGAQRLAQQATVEAETQRSALLNSLRSIHFDKSKLQPAVAPIAGFAAAFTEITLLFPSEYCKVQLQLNRKNKNFSLLSHLKERGFRIYEALAPMLIGAPLQGLLRFSCLDVVQKSPLLQNVSSPALSGLVAGVFAGIVESVFVVTPMETVKTKLIDSKMSLTQGVRHVVQTQGFAGLYNGLVPTIFKSASNQAIRFVVFNQYKDYMLRGTDQSKLTVGQSLGGGITAGLVGVLLNTPVDTVKSRMQSLDAKRYGSSWNCVKMMVKEEGVGSLYKGLLMRSARVVPGQGVMFLVYEQVSTGLTKFIAN